MEPPIFAARLSVHRLRRLISSRLMFWFVLLLLPVAVLTVLAGVTGAKKPESPTTIVERNLTVAPALRPPAPPSTTFTVNNLGDTGDAAPGNGACADGSGQCTLRAAIQEANSLAGTDTIEFSVTGTIQLGSVLPDLSTDITISGPGANLLTVRRNTGGDYRIFTISGGVTVAISGLTIANGKFGGGIYNEGGGIYNDGGTLTITNSTLSGNSVSGFDAATNYGGGIYNEVGTVTITNSTLSGNSASFGGGIFNDGGSISSSGGTVNVRSAIIAQNTAAVGPDVSGTPTSQGHNLIGDNSGATVTPTTGDQIGTSASPIDAKLGPLASNGGPTQTHALLPGSPAIDAGDDCVLSNTCSPAHGFSLTTDQRGFARQAGAHVDIGAVEVNYSISATAGTPQSAVINSAFATLLQATITESGNVPGGIPVTFTPPASGPSGTFSGLATVNTDGSGVATAPTFTANGTAGGPYNVVVSLGAGLPSTNFALTNLKANQTITFGALGNKTFGDPDFDVTATATSGLPVSFSASGPCTVTSLSPGKVHLTGGGSCTITASQAGDANFNVAPDVPQLFTIAKANQTITFGALGNKTFGDPDFDVTATATSALPVRLSASGPCTVTSLSPGKVHLTGGGSCTITASQAGDANFNVAPDVPQLFTIAQAATTTAVASSVNPSNFGQSVTFKATVTFPAGTPTGTVQFKDGGTNLGSPKTLNGSGVATFSTTSLVAGVHTITADYQGDGSFLNSSGTLAGGQQVGSIIKFSSASYNTTEGSGFTIITVQRIGDLSQAVTVDYATPDDSSAMMVLPCATANGVASPRCDFTTALGTLRFAAGDGADKTFTVLINQDSFVEGPETLTLTLSNLTGDAGFTTPGATSLTATLTIADDLTEPATNPLDDTETFVRQQYHDFLNREPDPSGLAFWKDNIDKCNDPARRPPGLTVPQCIELFRINTSAAFFLSIEFQGSGYYVERLYKVAFGDLSPPTVPVPVRFTNFLRDTQEVGAGVIVGQGNWQPQLDNNKSAFALLFVQRPAFLFRYPALTSATAFVDSLNANAGGVLSDSERSAFIAELSPNGADPVLRAGVLRKIADHATLQEREFSRAFVLMQYVGYLRRNPDAAPEPNLNFDGYNFWLNKLNQFNGDFNQAEMVRAFINSIENRQRFGP